MAKHESTFRIKSWDEKPIEEYDDGTKVTRAQVRQTYEGDIAGKGSVEYLMYHRGNGTARFVGLERISGSVGERSGTFVVQHEGSYNEGKAEVRSELEFDQ